MSGLVMWAGLVVLFLAALAACGCVGERPAQPARRVEPMAPAVTKADAGHWVRTKTTTEDVGGGRSIERTTWEWRPGT